MLARGRRLVIGFTEARQLKAEDTGGEINHSGIGRKKIESKYEVSRGHCARSVKIATT